MIAFVFFSLLGIFSAGGSSICASVSTLAGGASSGTTNSIGTNAGFYYLQGTTVDSFSKMIYAIDGNLLRKIDLTTKMVSILAGGAASGFANGVGTSAAFKVPRSVVVDSNSGTLYVTDSWNYMVRSVVLSTQTVSVLAGSLTSGSTNGIGTSASFKNTVGIVLDSVTNVVYVADATWIRAIVLSTKSVTTIAGSTTAGSVNGVGTSAAFTSLAGISLDSLAGIIYAVDQDTHTIKAIKLSTKMVTTLAGNRSFGISNGVGSMATFSSPSGIAVDSNRGIVYIADYFSSLIRAITTSSSVVSTIAGSSSGNSDGYGTQATFKDPSFISVDSSGVVFVSSSNVLRVVNYTLCPAGGYSLTNNSWKACPAGTWSSLLGAVAPSACINCSVGKFSAFVGADTDCTNCFAGSFSPYPGASSCAQCLPGSFCPSGSSTETPCPQGTYSRDPAFPCIPCIAGTYGNLVGAASSAACYPCPQGSFCPTGSSFATSCPLNTYSITPLATSNSTCLPCPASTYTMSPGQTSCMSSGGSGPVCSSGTYLDYASSTNCTKCSAGTFNPQSGSTSISSCLVCSAGSYSTAPGSSSCMPCTPGKFSPVVGSSSASTCLPCELGTFNPYFGLSSCPLDCPAGYFGTSVGGVSLENSCTPCGTGYYSFFPGSLRCSACVTGTYADTGNASFCLDCPSGRYGSVPAASSAQSCLPCPFGTFNTVPGQPVSACLPCPAGSYSGVEGVNSSAQCFACAPGSYSSGGLRACIPAPAGKYVQSSRQSSPVDCTIGTYNANVGSTSKDDCTPCPSGLFTAITGAISLQQCVGGVFVCPPGNQSSSPTPPSTLSQCAPLTCPSPLSPSALATSLGTFSDLSYATALLQSKGCAGCASGSTGTPGSCVQCTTGAAGLCPGLMSLPLWNFSDPIGLSPTLRGGASPWGACPRLNAPPSSASAPSSSASAPPKLTRAQQAAATGGSLLCALLAVAVLVARAPLSFTKGGFSRLETLAKGVDLYALSHEVREGGFPTKKATVLGGVFTLLGITAIFTYGLYMVFQFLDANTLVQRSLGAYTEASRQASLSLPWATAVLPYPSTLPTSSTGLVLRVTVDGEPGACATPLAFSYAGLLEGGAWALTSTANCGGSGVSQHTLTCASCSLTPQASVSLLMHYSCQSLLLEAAAIPSYPAGDTTLFMADPTVTAASSRGFLSALTWTITPLPTVVLDYVTAGSSGSARGYSLSTQELSPPPPQVLPSAGRFQGDTKPSLLVQPLAASVNVTIALPVSSTQEVISLTPLVPWTQVLANIVGLGSLLGVIGVAFGMAEAKLVAPPAKLAGLVGGPLHGGENSEPLEDLLARQCALESELKEHGAKIQRALERLKGGTMGKEGGSQGVPLETAPIVAQQAPGEILQQNPLHSGHSINTPSPTSDTATTAAASHWDRHSDGTDVWYVHRVTGEASWTIPG